MAREITGNAYESRGKWYARVSLGVEIEWKKTRTRRPNVALTHITDKSTADQRAKLMAECARSLVQGDHVPYLANTLARLGEIGPDDKPALDKVVATVRAIVAGKVPPRAVPTVTIGGETFGDVARMLTTGELQRKYPDAVEAVTPEYEKDRTKKLEKYILPILGPVPVTALSIDHGHDVMARVPTSLSKSTRKQILQHMKFVAGLAVSPLRLIRANPFPPELKVKAGADARARHVIYRDEDAAMLACVTNPIELRLAFGFQAREGMRREEMATLEWRDVDIAHGKVWLGENKTDDPRDWLLDPGVVRALDAWKRLQLARYPEALERLRERDPDATPPKAPRFVFGADGGASPLPLDGLAEELRACLRRAGVERAELFERTSKRMAVGTHDLRATFVTVASALGRNEKWISKRTGHRSHSMIAAYQRDPEDFPEGAEVAFVPLVDAIPELAKAGGGLAAPPDNGPESGHAASGNAVDSGASAAVLANRTLEAVGSIPISSTERKAAVSCDTSQGAAALNISAPPIAPPTDPIEAALATALDRASAAGEWSTVLQLARELEARRVARALPLDSAKVVSIDAKRRGQS